MATFSSCWHWNSCLFPILVLWCLCTWSIQNVHGQGNGAGAADNPTLTPLPPGGNPTTPGSPGEAAPPPPPPIDPSAPPLGGGSGGLSQPIGSSSSPTVTTGLVLPTVMFIPPPSSSSGVDMNATTPYFPTKSVSCQQCRYFYPKLVECNMIANQTLSLIPRLGEPKSNSNIVTSGPGAMLISKDRSSLRIRNDQGEREEDCGWDGGPGIESMMTLISKFGLATSPGSATSTVSDPTGNGNGNMGPGGASSAPGAGNGGSSSDQHGPGGASVVAAPAPPVIDFTSIMPFLQCICPNQGLAAAKVCLTCFRVSGQRNFLDGLTQQNVTTSLSAFAEACADSHDGTSIPSSSSKGQSASSASTATNGAGRKGAKLVVTTFLSGILGVFAFL